MIKTIKIYRKGDKIPPRLTKEDFEYINLVLEGKTNEEFITTIEQVTTVLKAHGLEVVNMSPHKEQIEEYIERQIDEKH